MQIKLLIKLFMFFNFSLKDCQRGITINKRYIKQCYRQFLIFNGNHFGIRCYLLFVYILYEYLKTKKKKKVKIELIIISMKVLVIRKKTFNTINKIISK